MKTDNQPDVTDRLNRSLAVRSSDWLDGLARDIVRTLEEPRVYRWTTWDSFAGRQIHHERAMGEVEAVIEVLKRHNAQPSNDPSSATGAERNDSNAK